jgi:hypothetical protein
MGLRDDAAEWAGRNSDARRAEAEAAAVGGAPLALPDWHGEFVARLRSLGLPRFPVYAEERRKLLVFRSEATHKLVYRRTGESVWVVSARVPSEGGTDRSYLGVTDTAVGRVYLADKRRRVTFRPFTGGDAGTAGGWRRYVVPLYSALLDSRTSVVDHETKALVQVLRRLADDE